MEFFLLILNKYIDILQQLFIYYLYESFLAAVRVFLIYLCISYLQAGLQ